jgi:hypothetical protein
LSTWCYVWGRIVDWSCLIWWWCLVGGWGCIRIGRVARDNWIIS